MITSLVDQYRTLHASMTYGASSAERAPFILPHVRHLKPRSVIDYGCGQSALPDLIRDLGVTDVYRYDPAIPAYEERPTRTFDLLVSIDVLEHIPEPELDDVLNDMRALAHHALLVIDIRPAKTILPNGQNAHATVKPPEWWKDRLSYYYDYLEPFPFPNRKPRACFKTWATPAYYRPIVRAHSYALRKLRRITTRKFSTVP